jgi:hypothetical protein
MSTVTPAPIHREPELLGQTVVVAKTTVALPADRLTAVA